VSSATNQLTTRRSVLRKGLAALGALAGAGAVLGSRSTNALAASGSFNASGGGNAAVTADATAGATGVKITTDGGPAVDVHGGAISVVNMNGGQGVSGYSQHSTGVSGVTSQPGGWAVAGIAFGTKATGVYGEGIESGGPGVFGNADEGDGVIGSSGRAGGVPPGRAAVRVTRTGHYWVINQFPRHYWGHKRVTGNSFGQSERWRPN